MTEGYEAELITRCSGLWKGEPSDSVPLDGGVLALVPVAPVRQRGPTRDRLLVLVGGLWLSSCNPAPRTPDDALTSFLEAVHQTTGFSGAVVVSRWGEPVFEGGWGMANYEVGAVFTPDSPADGASLAKTLVAAGLWQLQAEGALELADPVRAHVPTYPHGGTRLMHLLEHSAGISELDDASGLTNAEVVAALDAEPAFVSGSRFSYCNECFDVLALVTETVTGQAWPVFLEERFFEPFQMDSAFVRPALLGDWEGVRTRSYRLEDGAVVAHDVYDDEPFYGSSNVYLSARDLANWGAAFVQTEVLSSAVVEQGEEKAEFASGGRSALNRLNWFQTAPGGPAYFDGHLRGFHSVLYWDASTGLVVAWVSNTLGARPVELQLTRELVRIAEGGQDMGPPRFSATGLEAEVPPSAVEGVFRDPGLGEISVRWRDGIIGVSLNGGPERPGYPLTGYYVPDLGVEIGFSDLQAGRYSTLHWLTVFDSVAATRQGG